MKLRHLTTSALALMLMAGCDDSGTGVEPDDIAGTWSATAIVFTQTAAPNESVDLVTAEQATVTLVLGADATYTFTFTSPMETETETGTYTVSGSTLTLNPTEGEAETFTIVRNGDSMTLTGADTFEFDEQAGEEAATLVVTVTR